MSWPICLMCCLVLLTGCGKSKSPVQGRLEAQAASGAASFDFAAESPFAWDRLYIFAPYSPRASVEKSLGFAWPDYRQTSIESSDSVCLVIFVKDSQVVHWFEQPRFVDLCDLASKKGYGRSEATFEIHREQGRVALRSASTPVNGEEHDGATDAAE